ncbi:Protein phosphatase 2C 2 [Coemansia sp. RSA 552]|nr:Protein phosphatase 2C 2 [Coemansia sp. RSA 552]
MEDAHTTLLKLGPDGESAFFAVYDGHGGQTAAKFAGAELHSYIIKEGSYAKGDFAQAIKRGYMAADADLRETPEMTNDSSGCTAVCVLLTKDGRVFCGNAGDSRCIISSKGQAIALSHDHKPTDEVELNRIVSGGGFVEFQRVNGNLALSRALGDFEFKDNKAQPAEKQIVTADPDVVERAANSEDEFLVIACDGIWDCMTNEQVVQFVHAKIVEGKKLDQVCEEMMTRCLASESELGGVGCDNMTVVIVALLKGKTEDEWYAHVKAVAEEAGLKSSPKIDRSGTDSDLPDDSNAIINAIISHATQSQDISSDDDSGPGPAHAPVDTHADAAELKAGAPQDVPADDLAVEPKPAEAKPAEAGESKDKPAAEH